MKSSRRFVLSLVAANLDPMISPIRAAAAAMTGSITSFSPTAAPKEGYGRRVRHSRKMGGLLHKPIRRYAALTAMRKMG
jgi:hypothetical protein